MDKPLSQAEARIFSIYARKELHFLAEGGFLNFWHKTPDEIVAYFSGYNLDFTAEKVAEIIGRRK